MSLESRVEDAVLVRSVSAAASYMEMALEIMKQTLNLSPSTLNSDRLSSTKIVSICCHSCTLRHEHSRVQVLGFRLQGVGSGEYLHICLLRRKLVTLAVCLCTLNVHICMYSNVLKAHTRHLRV